MRPSRLALPLIAMIFMPIIASLPFSQASAAEACTRAPSGFQLIDPGDDESGIGGTGIGPHGEHEASPRTQRSDDGPSGLEATARAQSPDDDGESGIGGTGIYGTVTHSDRLCVNGLEIVVPGSFSVETSQGLSSPSVLAVGHVVWVEAARTDAGLVARRIVLVGREAGQIEVLGEGGRWLVLSGRRIRLDENTARGEGLGGRALRAGQWIVVYGLPHVDGSVLASRVEPGRAVQIRAGDASDFGRVSAWIRELGEHAVVSLEGFVSGTPERPRVGEIEIDLRHAPPNALREGLRPGARVHVEGRLGEDGMFRVAPPPRPPRPSATPRTGRESGGLNAEEKPAPPKPPVKSGAMERPQGRRPEIRRPPKSRPQIERPTRDLRPMSRPR
ncbi:MAG: hypothetical protein GY910_19540 [bacterium]|nr:hypothetical protein [Deltaproteobacteria bacterium]MCP4907175.1 hypothetical protein [bacterium]